VPLDRPTLYGPELLRHAQAPHGTTPVPDSPTRRSVEVDNPLCGDRVRLLVDPGDPHHLQLSHATRGCALCIASASLMVTQVVGKPVVKARTAAIENTAALADHADTPLPAALGAVFRGLSAAPMRRSCVRLPWDALARALSPTGPPDSGTGDE